MPMPNKNRKEIVETLKAIREALTKETQKRPKSMSFSENLADNMTSGKGFMSSIREAARIENQKESEKLKKAMDPLNIVKKMTGGSRLATVLAGKALGRPDEDIRSTIGLPNKQKVAVPVPPSAPQAPTTPPPQQVLSDTAVPLLEQMAKSLGLILLRVTDIAKKMGAMADPELTKGGRLRDKTTGKFMSGASAREVETQTKLLKSIKDTLLGTKEMEKQFQDKMADAERVKKKESAPPTQVNKNGQTTVTPQQAMQAATAKPEQKDDGFFSNLMGSFNNLQTVIMGFGAAVGALMLPLDGLKGVMTSSMEGVKGAFESMKSIVTSVPEKITSVLEKGKDLISKAPEGVKDLASRAVKAGTQIGQKLMPKKPELVPEEPKPVPKEVPKEEPKTAKSTAKTASETAKNGATEAKEKKTSLASKTKENAKKFLNKEIPKRLGGGTVGRLIPGLGAALGLGFAVSRLMKGDYVGSVLEAVSGLGGAVTAVPAIISNLIRDTYQEQYGTFPEMDPLKAERLPELAKEVGNQVDEWLKSSGKAKQETEKTPETPSVTQTQPSAPPTSVPPQNTSGASISKSTNMNKELKSTPAVESPAAPAITVNNVNSQQTNATLSSIPSPRSQESSYLRSVDRNSAY